MYNIIRIKTGVICLIILQFLSISVYSQSFPEKCSGIWSGKMYIFNQGKVADSVDIRLTIEKSDKNNYIWKTEYLSPKYPLVKDYLMKLPQDGSNKFMLDEGDGIVLVGYLFGNKMYFVFETSGILLTSSYELINDQLVFEVSSGSKIEESETKEVMNYTVKNIQRVVLQKQK